MKYKLHCFAESGNAYKAALMLNLCGADWEAEFVDFFNGATKTQEFLELNELGEVPVLEAGDLVLSQTGVILDYLADSFEMFDSTSVPEHREVLRWLFFDNHKFTGNLSTLRFLRAFTDQGENDVTKFLEARVLKAISVVNTRVTTRDFVLGERPTIADISLCGYLFFMEEAQIDGSQFPELLAWLERIKALPGWEHPYDLMPRGIEV
jgi:glutathione S-transferase